MQFESQTEEGETFVATVISLSDAEVTLDLNHPLAGKTLNFDVKVVDVT
jgi:FKBP-type peptidyl-prolyl cis-trans isomerase 2